MARVQHSDFFEKRRKKKEEEKQTRFEGGVPLKFNAYLCVCVCVGVSFLVAFVLATLSGWLAPSFQILPGKNWILQSVCFLSL